MHFFCLLCIPLFFFLKQTNSPEEKHDLKGRSLWALPLGVLAALVQYILGPLIVPGEFGFSRWMSGFVDITGLPALIPFMAGLLLVVLKVFPVAVDYAGFALLWLAPQAFIRSISGNFSPGGSSQSPISLVLVPILWAVQAVGIAFFIACIIKRNQRRYVIIFSVLGIAALIIAATTSWWAFFAQRAFLGYSLLVVSFIPTAVYFIKMKREERKENNEEMKSEKLETSNDELGEMSNEESEIKSEEFLTTKKKKKKGE
jgi:hypothetical protein